MKMTIESDEKHFNKTTNAKEGTDGQN